MSSDRVRNLLEKQKNISLENNISDELKELSNNISNIQNVSKSIYLDSNNIKEISSKIQYLENNLNDLQPLIVMKSQIDEILIKFATINTINNDIDEIKRQINHISEEISIQTEKEISGIISATNNSNDTYALKKIKNDIDNLNKRVTEFTQNNISISDKLSKIEYENQDLLSVISILDSRTSQIEDQKIPSFQEDIYNIRGKLDLIKKINDDSSNEFRRNISLINNTLTTFSDSINKFENESDSSLSSIKDSLSQLRKNLDELPFQQQINNINDSLTSVLPIVRDLSKRVELNDNDISDLQKNVSNVSGNFERFKNFYVEESSKLSQKIIELNKQSDKLKNDFSTSNSFFSENIQTLIDNGNKVKSSYDLLSLDNEDIKKSISNISSQINNNSNSIETITKTLNDTNDKNNKILTDLKRANENLIMAGTERESKINIITQKLKDIGPVNEKIQNIINRIESLSSNLLTVINDSSKNNDFIVGNVTSLDKSVSSSNNRIDNIEQNYLSINSSINELNSQNSQLSSEINSLSSKINDMNINDINLSISNLNNSNSENASKITSLTINLNDLSNSQKSLQNILFELKFKVENDNRITGLIQDMKNVMDIVDSMKGTSNNLATLKQLSQDTNANTSAIEQLISQIDINTKSITFIQNEMNKSHSAPLILQELKSKLQNLNDNQKQILNKASDIEKAQVRNEEQISSLSLELEKLVSNGIPSNTTISNSDSSTLVSKILSQVQLLSDSNSSLNSITTILQNDFENSQTMIKKLNTEFESLNIGNIKSLIQQLESIKNNIQIGQNMPSSNDSMKWLPSYDLLSGQRDTNITSINDINQNAILMIGNKIYTLKGIKNIGSIESDTVSVGYGVPNKKGVNSLEVKGDIKIEGKINGTEISDLGRGPKMTQTIEASVGSLVSIPYNGPPPNYIKVMLEGIYSVPLSKTDGYLYSYNNGSLNILCGTNSIGTEFNSYGRNVDKKLGNYTIHIY